MWPGVIESDRYNPFGYETRPFLVRHDRRNVSVREDERDRLRRQLEIDRNSDHAGPEDAEIDRQELCPVLRQDRDSGPRRVAESDQPAGNGVGGSVEGGCRPGYRRARCAEIDEGRMVRRFTRGNVAQIDAIDHGMISTLPTTSRSSSNRSPSAAWSSGNRVSMTGASCPSAIIAISRTMSSGVQPFEPIISCSKVQR